MFMDLIITSNLSQNQRGDIDDFADFSPARILQIISSDTVLDVRGFGKFGDFDEIS